MLRQSENGRGVGSGSSSIRSELGERERDNAGLRSKLELLGRESAGLRSELVELGWSKPAVGSEILKLLSPKRQNCKMVMLRSRLF